MKQKRKPAKRTRQPVTFTLNRKELDMLTSLSANTGRNRSVAAGILMSRYQWLMVTADLSMISLEQFQLLCMLKDGIDTEQVLDAKFDLGYAVDYRLKELAEFAREADEMRFENDSPESRSDMSANLEIERSALVALRQTIDGLDHVQCIALLEKIEEVYGRALELPSPNMYEIVRDVYTQRFRHAERK